MRLSINMSHKGCSQRLNYLQITEFPNFYLPPWTAAGPSPASKSCMNILLVISKSHHSECK
ncbi:hypothetical protein FRX31_008180 [Thalictrum thalictroides]|uniref:Uncharacterized protein n=1 Tax=Thalictrum thalictroides TaxID=46969 RepID=A0A7J6WYT2_THATH|nr:hypothetical protein FRX31_008180 [Thalictrum thalictroides]